LNVRAELDALFAEALAAVHGARAVERSLRARDPGDLRWTLLAAGKAACAMAEGARAALGERIRAGLVVTKDGCARAVPGCEVHEAAHPLPDARGVAAAERALDWARALGPGDGLLVLLSGGASALWTAPVAGVSLAAKAETTELLLRAGVDIEGLNAVRRALSRIKGGGLARACTAERLVTLAVSDVAGDPPATIGSGPTAPERPSAGRALAVLRDAGIAPAFPAAVRAQLEARAQAEQAGACEHARQALRRAQRAEGERSSSGSPRADDEYRVVASLDEAIEAACRAARARGLAVHRFEARLAGEARALARTLAEAARRARAAGADLLVAGGEPTVVVRGSGTGGRAQELALAFAVETAGEAQVAGLFAGTDGSDGPTNAAGAYVDGALLARGAALGLDAEAALARNDSHTYLRATRSLVTTGPTDTNVTDLALIRLGCSAGSRIR
jgi:glycerate 2-kinase